MPTSMGHDLTRRDPANQGKLKVSEESAATLVHRTLSRFHEETMRSTVAFWKSRWKSNRRDAA
jgi:hypothetical protein